MSVSAKKKAHKKPAAPAPQPFCFRFRRLPGGGVLLTNDAGARARLTDGEFRGFSGGLQPRAALLKELSAGGFIRNRMDIEGEAALLGEKFFAGWEGPHVHIISLNALCNLACRYCSAATKPAGRERMTRAAAAATLDFIFSLKPRKLMIEFQGGEPLLDFTTLKFIVAGARARAERLGREVNFSIVTNLSLMDAAKLEFLLANKVTVCTSLDGPASLHDLNRPLPGASSHALVEQWLRKIIKKGAGRPGFETPNAICTVTRASLGRAEEIVEEYARLGIMRVQLGPLEPLGRAGAAWPRLGYEPGEFLAFYKAALARILRFNAAGTPVYEKGALAFVKQMLGRGRPRYQNLDFVYRLAYNWDGGVYGSDEARMLANSGDEFFRLGSVKTDTFPGLAGKPLARFLAASCLNSLCQPSCARCAYSSYCLVSPVYNYLAQKNPWGDMETNAHCSIFKGILDMLFDLAGDKKNLAIFKKWDKLYD